MARTLHLIADASTDRRLVDEALAAGLDVVQLRDKSAGAADLFEAAAALLPAVRSAGAALFINDRVDVALAVGADGVHLGRRSLPPGVARRLAPGLLLGASVHTVEEAAALAPFVDYLTFGHVFPTPSHRGLPPKGPRAVEAVVAAAKRPVLAIGGIDAQNVSEVLAGGASGIVVISAIRRSRASPAEAVQAFRKILDTAPPAPYPDPVLEVRQR